MALNTYIANKVKFEKQGAAKDAIDTLRLQIKGVSKEAAKNLLQNAKKGIVSAKAGGGGVTTSTVKKHVNGIVSRFSAGK